MAENVLLTANWILNVLFYGPLLLIVILIRELAWFDVWLIVMRKKKKKKERTKKIIVELTCFLLHLIPT